MILPRSRSASPLFDDVNFNIDIKLHLDMAY